MRFNFIIIFLLCGFLSTAQFDENFDDGNLTSSPIWLGDVNDFTVTDQGLLQLQAPEAGSSYLYTSSNYSDSFEINIDLKMDFSPSTSNFTRIYFMLDNQDISLANGYMVNLGKNGSSDNIEIYKMENGNPSIIASGIEGTIASSPVTLHLKITRRATQEWEVFTSYDGAAPIKEFGFSDNSFAPSSGLFFGIECNYTSSRADKFLFDNISLQEYSPDLTPPQLLSAEFIDPLTIQLNFDEELDVEAATKITNYDVLSIGMPSIALLGATNNTVIIEYLQPFAGSIEYTIEAKNIKDKSGNVAVVISALLFFVSPPLEGELLISEILFDPVPSGKDFIEIYNTSDKSLQLQGLVIGNTARNESQTIDFLYVLESKSYIAISEDVQSLKDIYAPIQEANFIETDLPAFNNESGNLTLTTIDGTVLDAFDYHEEMHLSLIDDTEGVSLERLSFSNPTNESANWSSAARQVNFATPGYKNSGSIGIEPISNDFFSTINRVFSPNGIKTQYILAYDLKKPGYVANVHIYDSEGNKIKTILSNVLLGAQGLITWDGSDKDGNPVRLGIYLVVGELFNELGEVIVLKKTCVVADLLD